MSPPDLRGLTRALAGLCLVLTALCLAQLAGLGRNIQWSQATLAAAPMAKMPAGINPQPVALQTYSAIWLKPLFTQGRTPDTPKTMVKQTTSLGDMVLTGVVITPAFRVALFKAAGKTLVGREGQTVLQDWQVTHIEPRQVTLTHNADQQTLQLPIARSSAQPP